MGMVTAKPPKFSEGEWVVIKPVLGAPPDRRLRRVGHIAKRQIGYSGRWIYDVDVEGTIVPEVAEPRLESAEATA
jgi:hypothetical protein